MHRWMKSSDKISLGFTLFFYVDNFFANCFDFFRRAAHIFECCVRVPL